MLMQIIIILSIIWLFYGEGATRVHMDIDDVRDDSRNGNRLIMTTKVENH